MSSSLLSSIFLITIHRDQTWHTYQQDTPLQRWIRTPGYIIFARLGVEGCHVAGRMLHRTPSPHASALIHSSGHFHLAESRSCYVDSLQTSRLCKRLSIGTLACWIRFVASKSRNGSFRWDRFADFSGGVVFAQANCAQVI